MITLNKFKIPTLLGLGVILFGIAVGVFLVLKEQTFLSSASPSLAPQNITVSNIEELSVVISWQTPSLATGFVKYGQNNASEETGLDDRDAKTPQPHLIHYVTIKNLLPKTTYQYKIISGKLTGKISTFTTAAPANSQNTYGPIIGSVLDTDKPLDEGIAYLSLSNGVIQTSLIKNLGNFLIPLTSLRKEDLSDILPLDSEMNAKITIIAGNNMQAIGVLKLKPEGINLPPLKLGESVDLTSLPSPTPVPLEDLNIYDLNKDGKINSADYSIAQKSKGKKVSSLRGDLVTDRIINQLYLDELTQMVNTLNQ